MLNEFLSSSECRAISIDELYLIAISLILVCKLGFLDEPSVDIFEISDASPEDSSDSRMIPVIVIFVLVNFFLISIIFEPNGFNLGYRGDTSLLFYIISL